MFRKPETLLMLLLMLSATSCAANTTATAIPAVSDYCLIAKGISFSKIKVGQIETAENKYDTPETVKAVEEHDLAYERVCKKDQ